MVSLGFPAGFRLAASAALSSPARHLPPSVDLVTLTQACEPRSAWLRCLPLITAWQLARSACGEDTLGVGVPPSCHVALRGDQHVLAQRRKVLGAERTAVGGGLAVLRRTDRPPPNARVASLHSGILPQERAQRQQPRACSPTVTAAETMRVTASVARVVIAAEAARGTVAETPCCEAVECVRASRGSLGTARPGGRSRSCRLVRRDVGAARHRVALRREHH